MYVSRSWSMSLEVLRLPFVDKNQRKIHREFLWWLTAWVCLLWPLVHLASLKDKEYQLLETVRSIYMVLINTLCYQIIFIPDDGDFLSPIEFPPSRSSTNGKTSLKQFILPFEGFQFRYSGWSDNLLRVNSKHRAE